MAQDVKELDKGEVAETIQKAIAKVCTIEIDAININLTEFPTVLNRLYVDEEVIDFTGEGAIEYFTQHYLKLNYLVFIKHNNTITPA